MFDYTAAGLIGTSSVIHIATAGEVGTVWGTARNDNTKKVFMAATVKRHAGLGPLGLGGLYVSDITNPAAAITTSFIVSSTATTSVQYALTGLSGDGSIHTVIVTSTVCGSAVSAVYNAPMCVIPAVVEVSSATVCAGATDSLTATGCMSGTLNWSVGMSPSRGMLVTVATSATITTETILSYTVTCSTVSSTTTAMVTVTVSPLPSLTINWLELRLPTTGLCANQHQTG